jgi:small GTP-binding protein
MLACGTSGKNIFIFDPKTEYSDELIGHRGNVYTVAWSPDGNTLASGSLDKSILLWSLESKKVERHLTGHVQQINDLKWSPDGGALASCSDDGTVRFWNVLTGIDLNIGKEYSEGATTCLAWMSNGKIVASGSDDYIVHLWDPVHGKPIEILEGHNGWVTDISFSFGDKLLGSKSQDNTVRLWRCDTWETVAILTEEASEATFAGLAFHPYAPVLATLGEGQTIRIWDLDFNIIFGVEPVSKSTHYINAKVVLMGDTGVGKTGLGVRLAEDEWRPTSGSTHGMNVWTLHSEPEREVMLWDLAGQDEYRLVHQLFLNQTDVALLLYDPTKSQDTFIGIDYWEKALRNAVQGEVQKILVAARVDVGGVRMIQTDIEAYCKSQGYLAHFATSAETDEGCDELRAAIMSTIPWAQLPRTSSPEVFKHIKDFLTAVRQGKRILVRETDLRAEFDSQIGSNDAPTEDEFRTVIGHIETAGLIKRLSFGDFVLLKPELLNSYASDIIDAARRHADGLGAVRKADVLAGRVKLKDEGGLKASDKIFLLHATIELFLRLGLALEQDGNLVFPSKFNRQMPPLEEDPVVEVEFRFEGPVENLYTTLVVKLYYGGIFRLKKLWKNAAEFLNARERVCGFQLHSDGDGHGTLKVFYAEVMSDDDKALFLKIAADHFKDIRVDVQRERIYRCPRAGCREWVRDRNAVRRAIEKGVKEIPCLYCFKLIPLLDALEALYRDDKKFLAQITDMEGRAEVNIERGGELVSASAELRTGKFKEWALGADIATVAIVFTDILNSTKLNVEFGDEHWRQVREAHFALAGDLVDLSHGYLIKTIGDSIMAAFHSANEALDFALALDNNTGHELVKIRAGIHIGPVEVTIGDAFGQQVSMAARVEAKATDGGVWVSAKIKEDIDILRATKHRQLKWTEHPDEELKGFPQKCTLWSVEQ